MSNLSDAQKESLNSRVKMIESRMKEKGAYVFITGALWALIFMLIFIAASVYLFKIGYMVFFFVTAFLSGCCFMSFLCKMLHQLLYYVYKAYKKINGKEF